MICSRNCIFNTLWKSYFYTLKKLINLKVIYMEYKLDLIWIYSSIYWHRLHFLFFLFLYVCKITLKCNYSIESQYYLDSRGLHAKVYLSNVELKNILIPKLKNVKPSPVLYSDSS